MQNKDSIKFNHLQGFPRKQKKKNVFTAARAAFWRFCTELAGNRSGT